MPDSKPSTGEKIQGWIRTLSSLWPILLTLIAMFLYMKDQERDNAVANALQNQRLEVLENCQRDMQSAIEDLQESQDETNQAIATLNSNVENLNSNVVRIINILDE